MFVLSTSRVSDEGSADGLGTSETLVRISRKNLDVKSELSVVEQIQH